MRNEISWDAPAFPPINLTVMPRIENKPAPTDQEIDTSEYRLRASPYFLNQLRTLCKPNVSDSTFEEYVKAVVASHNMNVHFRVVEKDE